MLGGFLTEEEIIAVANVPSVTLGQESLQYIVPADVIQCGVRIGTMAREGATSAARALWRPLSVSLRRSAVQ